MSEWDTGTPVKGVALEAVNPAVERLCKVDALGCAILGRHVAFLQGSPVNLDLGPAFTRAQAVVNGRVAAIPGLIVALVVFGGFFLVAAPVKGVVARLTGTRLHAHRNAGVVVPNDTDVPASRKVADAIRHLSGSKPRGAEGE